MSLRYEAEIRDGRREEIRRYLTDKGRATMLRLLDDGRRSLSAEEIEVLTVPPEVGALLERTEQESRDGA